MASPNRSSEEYKPHANIANEQKLIAYLMRNPGEVAALDTSFLVDPVSQQIFTGIKEIVDRKLKFDLDTLKTVCLEQSHDIPYSQLQGVYERHTDFENIDFVKDTARNNALKFRIHDRIKYEYLAKVRQADYLKVSDLQLMVNNLQLEIDRLAGRESQLLTWKEMAAQHKDVLEQRSEGKLQRSLGFKVMDQMLARPAAEEEFTLLAGSKMHGKSILLKTMEMNLVKRGVLVLSLNLEMSKRSSMDRIICVKGGLALRDLQQKDMDPSVKKAAGKILDTDMPNYLYCPSETMRLEDLDAVIRQAQHKFKQLGLLPEDRYIVVTIDSLDMVEGFDDARAIKVHVDKFHKIIRKNGCHAICLTQLNENQIRDTKLKLRFKTPEDLDYLRFTDADIFGGSYYSARARAVFIINRPLLWKRKYFPEMEERWQAEEVFNDIMHVSLEKVNDGGGIAGYIKFNFEGAKLRITAPRDGAVAT